MEDECTFLQPEELLEEALKGLERTEELTRKNRALFRLLAYEESPPE